jgi:hypothetical protein
MTPAKEQHDPRQTQFLNVVTRDEATARFQQHLKLEPLGTEKIALGAALGRILAGDVKSSVDVPGFDRSMSMASPSRLPIRTVRWRKRRERSRSTTKCFRRESRQANRWHRDTRR